MNEIQAHAGAGFERRPHLLGLLDDLRAFLATPYRPSTDDSRLFLLDLSQYNTVDMNAVKAFLNPEVKAVIIRIGGSASVRDTKFQMYWNLARELEIRRSIYTYNWPGWSVDLHIENFMETVELWTPGDLGEGPIWLDVECHADKSRKEVSDNTIGIMSELVRETGKVVGWYSADWFLNSYMELQDWMKEKWAWWAQWLSNQPNEHPGPVSHNPFIPSDKIVIHQTGSNCDAQLFGGSGRVDTDRWESTQEVFYELFGGEEQEPPPSGDLEEIVRRNTEDIEELWERVNIINDFLRSYDER